MLELLAIILVILWLVGSFLMHLGQFIHLLLVLALVVVGFRLARGKVQPSK